MALLVILALALIASMLVVVARKWRTRPKKQPAAPSPGIGRATPQAGRQASDAALGILDKRLARGEIGIDEYEELRRVLMDE